VVVKTSFLYSFGSMAGVLISKQLMTEEVVRY